eukprot:7280953-Lingulodinium_polyedra.AAC.1
MAGRAAELGRHTLAERSPAKNSHPQIWGPVQRTWANEHRRKGAPPKSVAEITASCAEDKNAPWQGEPRNWTGPAH